MRTVTLVFGFLAALLMTSGPVLWITAIWATGDNSYRFGLTGLITFVVGAGLMLTTLEMDADL